MSSNRGDASGFRRWWEVKIPTGGRMPDGSRSYVEGFYDIKTGKTCMPDGGWNGEPDRPEDFVPVQQGMGGSDEFWANMAAAKEQTTGEVVLREAGRTVIRYG